MRILMKVAKVKAPNLSKVLKGLPRKPNGEFAKILARLKLLEKSSSVGEKPTSKVALPRMRDDLSLDVKEALIAKESFGESTSEIREGVASEKGRTDLPDEAKILEARKRACNAPKERETVVHLENREATKGGGEIHKGDIPIRGDSKRVEEKLESAASSRSRGMNEIPEGMHDGSKHERAKENSYNTERKDLGSFKLLREGSKKTPKLGKVIDGTRNSKGDSVRIAGDGRNDGEIHEERKPKSQGTVGHEKSFSKTVQSKVKRASAEEGKPSEEASRKNTGVIENESGDFKRSSHPKEPKTRGENHPRIFERVERENFGSLRKAPRIGSRTPKSGAGEQQEHHTETPGGSIKGGGFQKRTEEEKGSTEFRRLESRRQGLPRDSGTSEKTSKEVIFKERIFRYEKNLQKPVEEEKTNDSHRQAFRSTSRQDFNGMRTEYEEPLKASTSEHIAYEEDSKGKMVVSEISTESEEEKSKKPIKIFDKTRVNAFTKRVRTIGDQSSPVKGMINKGMIENPPHVDGNVVEIVKESTGSDHKKAKRLKIELLEKSASKMVDSDGRATGSASKLLESWGVDRIEVDDRHPRTNPRNVLAKVSKRKLKKPVEIGKEKRYVDEQPEGEDRQPVNETLNPKPEISIAKLNVKSDDSQRFESFAGKRPTSDEMSRFLKDVKVESQFPEKKEKKKILKVEKLEIVIEKKVRKAYGRLERGSFDEIFERVREMRKELEGVKTFALDKNSGEVENVKVSVDEMIERVHRIVESLKAKPVATERARMELIPPDLGKVEVEIVKKGDELSVFFKVSTDEAKDLIERRIEILSHRLSNDGFNVEKIEVRLERENEDELPEREEEKGQQRENHENEKKRKRREGEER